MKFLSNALSKDLKLLTKQVVFDKNKDNFCKHIFSKEGRNMSLTIKKFGEFFLVKGVALKDLKKMGYGFVNGKEAQEFFNKFPDALQGHLDESTETNHEPQNLIQKLGLISKELKEHYGTKKIVIRDMEPDKVLVFDNKGAYTVKVSELGNDVYFLTRNIPEELTKTTIIF